MLRWKCIGLGMLALIGTVAMAQQAIVPLPLTPQPAGPDIAKGTPVVAVNPAGRTLSREDADAWLDGYMPFALHSGDLAGAVVVIVKDGQVLTARGYGYADIAKRKPVDPERTLFRPGSVSKLVTWTAVMQLVEQGRLDLDRDVNTYLDFKIPPRDGKPITLRQIMTHTAGFEEAAKDIISYDTKQVPTIETYLKRWTPHRIFAPGTTPAYSNWATTLAGYIVQRASAMPFDDYVERNIFAPLGMRNSTFRQPLPKALEAQMAVGYPRASVPAKPFEVVVPAPAGSLSSSGMDMARFMIAHLQDGALNGQRILRPETAQVMHQSPLDRVNPMSLIPPLNRMELGFFETNINGREVIAHLGDTENFHTSLHLFLKDNVGLYVSFNSAGKEGAAHNTRAALFEDFADRYFPTSERDGRVPAKEAAEHARMMAGAWVSSRHSASNFLNLVTLLTQTEISVGPKGELVIPALKGTNGAPKQWDEIAPFVWRERGGHERLAAKVEDGKVVRWSFDLVSPFIVFDRVPAGRSAAWILPVLYLSLAVLLLTFLYWPVSWLTRRHYGSELTVTGQARRAYRATRIMAGLDLAVLIGWAAFVVALLGDTSALSSSSDIWLWLLQIAGAIVFVGAVGIAGWNAWLTWRDGRRWTRKLWSALVLLATIVVLYVAATFGLIAMTVNY